MISFSRPAVWIPVVVAGVVGASILVGRSGATAVCASERPSDPDGLIYSTQRAEATEAMLHPLPTRAIDDLGALEQRIASALAAADSAIGLAESEAIAGAVVAFLERRYAAGSGAYALGELAGGRTIRDVETLIDENAAPVIHALVGGAGEFDDAPLQNVLAIFDGIDALDDGSSHLVAYVDAAECVAVSVGQWGALPQLSTAIGTEHWHGARAIRGRSWFERGGEPDPEAPSVTVGFFARFADGGASAMHLRLTPDDAGTWVVQSVSRHGAASPLATLDF